MEAIFTNESDRIAHIQYILHRPRLFPTPGVTHECEWVYMNVPITRQMYYGLNMTMNCSMFIDNWNAELRDHKKDVCLLVLRCDEGVYVLTRCIIDLRSSAVHLTDMTLNGVDAHAIFKVFAMVRPWIGKKDYLW
jgi:hypothetical protein